MPVRFRCFRGRFRSFTTWIIRARRRCLPFQEASASHYILAPTKRSQRSERTFRKTEGLISRSYSNRIEVSITVRNQRRSTVQLDLLERIAVSADERKSVDVVPVEPSPLEKSDRGIYRFRLTLKPGEIRKIRLFYDLTHGADVLPVMNETGVDQRSGPSLDIEAVLRSATTRAQIVIRIGPRRCASRFSRQRRSAEAFGASCPQRRPVIQKRWRSRASCAGI